MDARSEWLLEERQRFEAHYASMGWDTSRQDWLEWLDVQAFSCLERAQSYYEEGRTVQETVDYMHREVESFRYPAVYGADDPEARLRQLKSMPYPEYLRSPEWIETRDAARRRALHRCVVCNSTEGIQIHHRTYERRGEERSDDVIALCGDCHELFHRHRRLVR